MVSNNLSCLPQSNTENQVHSHSPQMPVKLLAHDPPQGISDGEAGVRNHPCPSKHQGSQASPFCSHTANTSSTAICLYAALVPLRAATQRSHAQTKTAQ